MTVHPKCCLIKQHFFIGICHILTTAQNQNATLMVRYVMSFTVPQDRQQSAQKIIDHYFDELYKHGPGGMRSQCYADYNNACNFIHIKSFKKESVANHHFKSGTFREYVEQLSSLCGSQPSFSRLQQQQTFESIY